MKNNFFLIDMDNFYSSCEVIERKIDDSSSIVVGGNYTRSVVSSCNKVAKDAGIRAGMPIFQAKKLCPSTIFLPVNFYLYEKSSQKIEKILLEYSKTTQKTSIDEWFLDFSESDKFSNEIELAEFIKTKIFKTLGLKASIGIGNSFFNAKTASYYAKPFGVFVIDRNNFEKFVWSIPIEEMYMVGKKRATILKSIGIQTIGQLATFESQRLLHSLLGKNLETLLANSRNVPLERVRAKKQSISSGQTFLQDKADYDDIIAILKSHFKTIQRKLVVNSQLTKTIALVLKTSLRDKRKQHTLYTYTDNEDILWSKLLEIFDENWNNKVLRGVGISFDNVINHFEFQYNQNLFLPPRKSSIIDQINRDLGYKAVSYARIFKK